MELVSVIVPAYNVEKYIEECISSILNSSYKNIEIIIVDDGSKDDTYILCKRMQKKNEIIKVFSRGHHGVSQARNQGLEMAEGEYIVFVDGDDKIANNYIETLYEHMHDSDIAIAGYTVFYDDNKDRTIEAPGLFMEGGQIDLFSNIGLFIYPPYLLSPCFKMYKTKIIKENRIKFPINLSYGEDAIFSIKYISHIYSFKSFVNSGYYYRRHSNETLSTKFRREMLISDIEINHLLESCFEKLGIEDKTGIINRRTVDSFYLYSVRLMCSDVKNKKAIFFNDVQRISMRCFVGQKQPQYWILRAVVKTKKMFFLMHLYRIKPFIKKWLWKLKSR